MTQTALMPDWMQARLAGNVETPGEVEIVPDEAAAVTLFLALATQWNVHPLSGVFLGINYSAIPPTAGMAATPMTPALFADLQIMERAALDAAAEKGNR